MLWLADVCVPATVIQQQYPTSIIQTFESMPNTIFTGLNMENKGYLLIKSMDNDLIAQNDPHDGPILDICLIQFNGMKFVFTCANDGLRCFNISPDNKQIQRKTDIPPI